jgi:peptidoglycan/xylan/chitin deacetylase (PgdA/CDA1 family)
LTIFHKKGFVLIHFSFSRAHVLGFASYFAAFLLVIFDVRLAAIPLFLFVIFCVAAPFLPQFGFFLPIVSRGSSRQKAVSITFDDGPDPNTTELLLALLERHGVKATFFVVGKRAAAQPSLIQSILEKGHSLGNHSYRHDNFLMLRNRKQLLTDIRKSQEVFARFHIRTLAFRPPVGITNPKLGSVLKELGMIAVNFSCRGMDAGNRRVKGLSRRILRHLEAGHIIVLHDVMPKGHASKALLWIKEVEKVLQGIKDRGFKVLPLSELIGQPVMIWESAPKEKNIGP